MFLNQCQVQHTTFKSWWACLKSHLAIRGGVDAVVIDSTLVAQRDWALSGTALALSHQKASVDAAAQQVFGGVTGHGSVIPAVFLQTVDGGDVVTGHPALAVLRLSFTPLAIVIVSQNPQLLSWDHTITQPFSLFARVSIFYFRWDLQKLLTCQTWIKRCQK